MFVLLLLIDKCLYVTYEYAKLFFLIIGSERYFDM